MILLLALLVSWKVILLVLFRRTKQTHLRSTRILNPALVVSCALLLKRLPTSKDSSTCDTSPRTKFLAKMRWCWLSHHAVRNITHSLTVIEQYTVFGVTESLHLCCVHQTAFLVCTREPSHSSCTTNWRLWPSWSFATCTELLWSFTSNSWASTNDMFLKTHLATNDTIILSDTVIHNHASACRVLFTMELKQIIKDLVCFQILFSEWPCHIIYNFFAFLK